MKPLREVNSVLVLRKDQHIGTLKRTEAGCEFEYVKNPAFPVCSQMPTEQAIYRLEGVNLFPYFANLLPEGTRTGRVARSHKTSLDDLFTLLLATAGDAIGDVSIADAKGSEYGLVERPNEVKTWAELREFRQDTAGVQDKLSGRTAPARLWRAGKPCLIKFGNPDFPYLVENEHFFMELARKCGLDAAKTQIQEDETGEKALIVTRFDRAEKNRKLAQEDGCQVMGLYPASKFSVQFHTLVERMSDQCASPVLAASELIRQYIFAYMIGNGDLHAKNLSVVEDARSGLIKVSPVYDALTTLCYPLDQNMALSMLGKASNFKRGAFIELGARFKVPESKIVRDIDIIGSGVLKHVEPLQLAIETKMAEKVMNGIRKRIARLTV